MPLDLFSFMREAGRCFHVGCFLGAIALASNLVEIILNRDSRVRNAKLTRIKGWATLYNHNLNIADESGLPVKLLLSPTENTKQAEKEALDQIVDSAERFLVEWFNTAPVQQKRIRKHCWPA